MGIQEQREQLARQTRRMLKAIQVPAAKINKIKAKAANGSIISSTEWARARKEVNEAYREIDKLYIAYSESAIPKSYKIKVEAEIKRMKRITIPVVRKKIPNIVIDSRFHKGAIKVLTDQTILDMTTTVLEGQKMTQGLLRRTQQAIVTEQKLNLTIAEGLSETGTIQGTKNRILVELKNQLSEPYVLKAGSKRYKAETYAEMLTRTRTREAQSVATTNVAADVGSDLVQVDSHNTTTPICIPYEGKIFSISGRDPDFPPLQDIPPFHPNCEHNITVTFREVLERRGIDKYIDFANGKTEIHPTRTAHIPVSERGIEAA